MAGTANSQQRRKAALGQAKPRPVLTAKVSSLARLYSRSRPIQTIASGCFYGHAGSKTMVARDLNRWLERNKHLAQDVTRRQRSPNPHDSRRR